jgi:chromosome segregation ATPase
LREEIASLKLENQNKQNATEKVKAEKVDADSKFTEIQKELTQNKSTLNESENTVQRQEKEIARINRELEVLKEQCRLKDEDLRSAIHSLKEIQTQSVGERNGLKDELM